MKIKIDTKEMVRLTVTLQKMHRSAFPSAIRNTLNDAAFESKKLIPEEAGKNFTIRQKTLFKKVSGVNKATGFNVNTMSAKVGLDGSKPKTNELVESISKQETGGTITGRKLIPHNMGRVSGSYAKKVKSKNYLSKIGSIGKRNKRVSGSKYIQINKNGSKGTVFEVRGKKLTPIYVYRKNNKIKVKPQPFIKPSALKAAKKLSHFYMKNAEFQFKKNLNR